MDKSWMYERNKLSPKFLKGVQSFIQMASNYMAEKNMDKCLCPCANCINANGHVSLNFVESHLYKYGMAGSYTIWIHHGEVDPYSQNQPNPSSANVDIDDDDDDYEDDDEIVEMIHTQIESRRLDSQGEGMDTGRDDKGEVDFGEFAELLSEAKEELYPGCTDFSSLTFLIKLMHIKVLNHMSNKCFEMLLQLLKLAFPKTNRIPKSYYDAKKMLRDLGLGYESIHACKNDCALFWKEHSERVDCPVCHESRYKIDDGKGKKIPHKILRYFPLKPRLQRLFSSKHTAKDMRWHKDKYDQKEGVLKHPADGEAWKDFDNRYPSFAQDPRNVRIGLATDGFNPFGNMSNSYSMWPVILIPYNLPPWKCMKEPFFMMSLLIPGPQAPGRDIDVYLRPLIDELKELWDTGVETYDASSEKSFRMHAAVLWTINDFPAYANLSGWSTKGYLACPVCNEDAPSIKLRSKICYMGHRRYLSPDHKWRQSYLHNGKHDYRSPPKKFTGDELLSQMNNIRNTNPGKHPDIYDKNRKRCPDELNWVKKSIFYELPYWKDHLIRHKLDVMHIEKNICDNIVGTLMNIEGKKKDTMKAHLDLEDMNIKKELHLKRVGNKFIKRPACYTLSPYQRRDFSKFLKSVKFPDGYAANISRSVNVNEGKISGLKSHDCHVLLQRLLPVGIRPYLKKDLCTPLIELCNFFHDLCAKTLTVAHLDEL
ncbi:uncharacterized protein LOC113280095 [Papaver somniferum]|uniref:uncharacterized protein LOC113280095 n=3 Tax=Papaver somniferum TaxID=3469 RepID=UPI000E6F5A2B|nr:uncharacterized protein LOC113280095 [Papaver somniferum]